MSEGSLGTALRSATTTISVDGREQSGRTSFLAAWRLIGFILWDAEGTIERTTTATVRGHSVRIVDTVTNGRVWVRVTIGPPLGDKRVKCAVLTLEATDDGHAFRRTADTKIRIACAAHIDLPGDRCRLVRRIASRVAEKEAGPELSSRVNGLADAGRRAVLAGRAAMPEIVTRFVEEVCR